MNRFHDFQIFTRTVRTGSMSAAGRELGLSPALISKRIKRLEERLGVRLLQRTTRQITLTDIGQGFFERVLQILANVEEAENFVTRRTDSVRGTLRVSAPTTFGRMHIAPHLKPFLEQNPELELTLDLSDDFVDLVGLGYDLAIRIGELTDSTHTVRKLASNTRILCATPDYLQKYGAPLNLEDLMTHQCIAQASQDSWRLNGPDGPVNFRPTASIKTNSSEVIRETLLAGVGIAIRSTWDIGSDLAAGRLQIVLPQFRGSSNVGLNALYPSRQFLPTKVRAFLDFIASLYAGKRPYWEKDIEHILNSE